MCAARAWRNGAHARLFSRARDDIVRAASSVTRLLAKALINRQLNKDAVLSHCLAPQRSPAALWAARAMTFASSGRMPA